MKAEAGDARSSERWEGSEGNGGESFLDRVESVADVKEDEHDRATRPELRDAAAAEASVATLRGWLRDEAQLRQK